MMVLIVTERGTARGLLACAFALAGLNAREVTSMGQADSFVGLLGPRNCVLVIAADSLSDTEVSVSWRAFLRSWPALPVVVTACAHPNDSILDLIADKHRILLKDPFDAAAIVVAVRSVCDRARDKKEAGHTLFRTTDESVIDLLV